MCALSACPERVRLLLCQARLLVELSELLLPDRRAALAEQMLLARGAGVDVGVAERSRVAGALIAKGLSLSERRPAVLRLLHQLPQSERLELLQGAVESAPDEELLALVRIWLERQPKEGQELFVAELCKVLQRDTRAAMAGSMLTEMDSDERVLLLRNTVGLMSRAEREKLQARLETLSQL